MDVDRQLSLAGSFRDPSKRPLADRVDGVRTERRRHELTRLTDLLEAASRHLGDPVGSGRVAHVEERRRDARAYAGVLDSPSSGAGVPVHVPEANGARADHLRAGEPRAPVSVLVVRPRLDRPVHLPEPAHQRQIVAVAPEQGHRGVGVSVDESRDDRHPLGVDHLVAVPGPDPRPDLRDRPILHAQPDALAVEHGVGHREAHGLSSLSSGTIAAISAPRRSRFWARPAWNSSTVSSLSPTPFARLSTMQTAEYRSPSSPAITHSEAIVMPITSACWAIIRISAGVSKRGPIDSQ